MRPREKKPLTHPTGVEYERCEWKEREVLSAHQPLSFAQPTPLPSRHRQTQAHWSQAREQPSYASQKGKTHPSRSSRRLLSGHV